MAARTIAEYFEERERECRRFSLMPESGARFFEFKGDSTRGRILMNLRMTERAVLVVQERIALRGNHVHREGYGYYLLIDEQEYWSRDYDHIHGYHGHTIGHKRIEAGRITFKVAVEECWGIVSKEENLTDTPSAEG